MGQYYKVYLKKDEKVTGLNRYVDGEYTGAKLMEHSWWLNEFVSTVTRMIYKNPTVIAWVGDYASDVMRNKDIKTVYNAVWGDEAVTEGVKKDEMYLDGKYLVNHSKKQYLDCDEYKKKSSLDKWCIHPLPLLTSIGNGQGGGDYWGSNMDMVGSWYLDEISVEDEIPNGYSRIECEFKE